jgi:DNA-binding LacI/PurR family transcriptional regulator
MSVDLSAKPIDKNRSRLQMQDIAKLAGVSVSTVSRALNGSSLVNDETRERVTALAKSLNYSIDIGAQNLRLKKNKTIAVVIPFDTVNPQHVSEPFFLTMLGYIADELAKFGYYMLVSHIRADNLSAVLETYDSGRAEGIIVIGQWKYHEQLNAMVENKPIVIWGAKMPNQNYISIGSDNIRGGFLATEHLIQQSCKRIAFFGDINLPEVSQRFEGYILAHKQYGIRPDERLSIPTPFSAETVSLDIQKLLNDSIDFNGIFACSDLIAMRAIGTLQKLNIAVPNEVAIVGYDDIVLASYFHPAISTIKQSIELGAQALVKSLFSLINNEIATSSQLEVSLVVRESSLREKEFSPVG